MDTRYHDCKYSERAKTVSKTLEDKWVEQFEREKERKKRQKEAAAQAEVASKKRREAADLERDVERAHWQMHRYEGIILWTDL